MLGGGGGGASGGGNDLFRSLEQMTQQLAQSPALQPYMRDGGPTIDGDNLDFGQITQQVMGLLTGGGGRGGGGGLDGLLGSLFGGTGAGGPRGASGSARGNAVAAAAAAATEDWRSELLDHEVARWERILAQDEERQRGMDVGGEEEHSEAYRAGGAHPPRAGGLF